MHASVAFVRDLAKLAPLGIYYLMRLCNWRSGISPNSSRMTFTPPLGRDEDETVHEDAPDH